MTWHLPKHSSDVGHEHAVNIRGELEVIVRQNHHFRLIVLFPRQAAIQARHYCINHLVSNSWSTGHSGPHFQTRASTGCHVYLF